MLGGSQLTLDKDLTIDASALPDGLVIDAGGSSRVLQIGAGSTVTLTAMTLTGGKAPDGADGVTGSSGGPFNSGGPGGPGGPGQSGGGILNDGTLTLNGMTLSGNAAGNGGRGGAGGSGLIRGIGGKGGVGGSGGALSNSATGTVSFSNGTIVENLSGSGGPGGPGLLPGAGGNGGGGGGVLNLGSLTVTHGTMARNAAGSGGGGVSPGLSGTGGGIQSTSSLTITNSILALNTGSPESDLAGSITTENGVNLVGGDPLLAPLGDYGGPTETMPPLPGSPATEGAVLLGSTPSTDQRGNPRPSGPLPDIGAVEAGSLLLGMLADTDNDGIPDVMEGPNGPYPHLTVGVDDSGVDTDGDGSTDAEEIANMTDPNDAGDSFRVLNFALAPGFDPLSNPLVSITFSSFPGLDYEAETDNALGSFEPVPGSLLTADEFTETVEVLLEPGAKSFGRVGRR